MQIIHSIGLPAEVTFLEVATTGNAPAQMWTNAEPTTAAKPCIRDYAELITKVIPEPIAQLVPLEELERRCLEVAVSQPRFREETPLLLAIETKRRAAYQLQPC